MAKNYKNTNNMSKNSNEDNCYHSSYTNDKMQNSKNAERAKTGAKNKTMNKTSDCHTKDYSDYNNNNY